MKWSNCLLIIACTQWISANSIKKRGIDIGLDIGGAPLSETHLAPIPPSHPLDTALRIVNGKKSKGFSWIASLQKADGRSFCGGALIAPKVILTAAHCLVDRNGSDISVQIGEATLEAADRNLRIQGDKIFFPPDFAIIKEGNSVTNVISDIAILTLKSASRNAIASVDLECMDKPIGAKVLAMGYGKIEGDVANPKPRNLNEVDLRFAPEKQCKDKIGVFDGIQYICIENMPDNYGGQTCSGDSGSPLLYKSTVIGVVSFSAPGCKSGMSVYAKACNYRDFIEKHIKYT